MPRQGRKPDRMALDKGSVPRLIRDDDMHHGQRQRRVRARPDENHLIRQRRGFGSAHVHDDDPGATPLCDLDMPKRRRLTDGIGPPEDHEFGILAQIFLRRGLYGTGQARTKPAEPPADHRGVPELAPVEVREPLHLAALQPEAIIVRQVAMPLPETDALSTDRIHPACHHIERVIPACPGPCFRSPPRAHQGREDPLPVADDLMGSLAPHAQEALTVRVGFVTDNRRELAVLHRNIHPAERRMAVHRAHGLEALSLGHFVSDQGGTGTLSRRNLPPPTKQKDGERSAPSRFRTIAATRSEDPRPALRVKCGSRANVS